ncbi:helix-turn-helix transcriptional regulator [Paracoccus yeei]|uniref:helix-turn-helix transcriptional regulator n=1 Tax=Paracoccus yeei TaxID=147645 RepID=UPI001749F7F7|nr:helix-turn-helix transcriptional regulator [Paracoccus yeei]
MSIAENVRKFRRAAKLSQAQLAERAGVTQQLVSQIERGENDTTKHLADIARALEISLVDLDPSIRDVTPAADYAERIESLHPDDRLVVEALVERLERARAASHQPPASPDSDPHGSGH